MTQKTTVKWSFTPHLVLSANGKMRAGSLGLVGLGLGNVRLALV